MIRYFVHRGGRTETVDRFDSSFAKATEADAAILRDAFGLHALAVEAAVQRETNPKVETTETDFFLSASFLVTVHDGQRRSIAHVSELCGRTDHILAEGSVALFHRIVDTMVDHYRPEVDEVEARLDLIEDRVIEDPTESTVGRLARREFDIINQEMAYRFRDVYDQFARMADDGIMFHDRVTGILDAHLASVSNRLADVSKVLAVIATLFGPMTVITGLFGMNVPLPTLLGSPEHQFWEIIGLMVVMSTGLFFWFRKSGWW